MRRPVSWTATKSTRRPRRCARRSRCERAGVTPLLLRDGDGELLAALAAAAAQDLAASLGAHALAETVGALAALAVGLESPFHGVLRASPRWGGGRGD